jgi:hypothetical protein
MNDSLGTSDNVVAQPELATDGSIRLLDEISLDSAYENPSAGVQATQQLVDAGQVPALEIVSSTAGDSFTAMISTDGLTVFNRPGRGHTDYFSQVDGMDDQGYIWDGTDGAITKTGIDSFIAEADAAPRGRFSNPLKETYVDSLRQLSANWDSPEMTPYKDTLDTMTRESFAAGMESLPLRQEQAASATELPPEQTAEIAVDMPAEAAPVDGPVDMPAEAAPVDGPVDMPAEAAPVDGPVDMPAEAAPVDGPVDMPAEAAPVDGPVDMPAEAPAAALSLTEETVELSIVRLGEGPYQVAERLLSSGESASSHEEVMALVRAMQTQYREEYPEDPNLASLKVNHQFLSPDKLDSLLNSISDPAMRDSIAAKLQTPAETTTADGAAIETGTTEAVTAEEHSVSQESDLPVDASSGGTDYFSEVDGIDFQGTLEERNDGVITKSDIDMFLYESVANNDMSPSSGDPLRDQFVESLRSISENWDNPEMAEYKDADGAMTRESFVASMEAVPLVEAEVAAEGDAITEHIDANQPEVFPPALSETAAELSQVRSGEGPYQVAARILASGGSTASNAEVTALMRAMQAQYRQENPDDANMAVLKQGHQFLTAESLASVLENISDAALRASIEAKITQQDS